MNTSDIIVRMCIYHYLDTTSNTYFGYLGNSALTKTKEGKFQYKCLPEDKQFTDWYFAGTFYAVNPTPSHPIQTGMKLFSAKINSAFPYNTTSVSIEYDPFSIDLDSVYFIAYTQIVPYTIPLYFHTYGDNNIYPSFDKYPPSEDPGWSQISLSPIYVISPSMFNAYLPNKIPFKCVNEKCIPWIRSIPDMYDDVPDEEIAPLDKCILLCSGLGLVNEGVPLNMIQNISIKGKPVDAIQNYYKRISPLVTGLVAFLFVIALFSVIVLTQNRKKL